MCGTIGITRGCLFFFIRFLSASARRPRGGRRNVGEGLRIPFDDYYRGLCHVSCRTTSRDSSVYIYIRIHIGSLLRCYLYRERKTMVPWPTRGTCPCISRLFDHAGHYRRQNKSKSREQARPFAIRRRERESFINLCARTTYSRELEALCHLVLACCGRIRA